MHTPILAAQGLSQKVLLPSGPLTILENVSFSLPKASTLAIVGASGSGKSTLLGLLAGLDTASEGTVHLAGHNLSCMTENDRALLRAKKVGFVFQSFHLLPTLTALENVMLPLELAGQVHPSACAKYLLERVGLAHRLHHIPKLLSGGEQQRVAIARAFATAPAILFADEPTGSLDTQTGQEVMTLLFDMHQQQSTTLVLVTHNQALAAKCSYQLCLSAGRMQCWKGPS